MYAGHFAAGLALKARVPKAPTWGLLLGVGVLDVLFGVAFLRLGRGVALTMGIAVFSHFVLDLVMHPADLALWPGSSVHPGFGLWRALPTGWWFVELAVIAGFLAYYWGRAKADVSFGGRPVWVAVTVLILHVLNSPWLSAT